MAPIKILIAENDQHYRESLVGAVLKDARYRAFPACNPQKAREVLTQELIHLAIVDIRLENDEDPNDETGLALCREMDRTIGKILLTGFRDERQVREALRLARGRGAIADSFLFKSEGPEAIRAEVHRVLSEQFEIVPRERIAVVTSGGDSPGMNAAIWGLVRTAMANEIEVMGIEDGYQGLTEDRLRKLTWNSTNEALTHGGTMLGTARYTDFKKPDIRARAVENLIRRHITGLVVIGGDGSMQGATALAQDIATVGGTLLTVALPGTIDNDVAGTDMSLGAASAANAIAEELAKLIPPAQALRRIFVVEVMGRYSGFLALEAALAAGADALVIPETLVLIHPNSKQESWRVNKNETEGRLRERLQGIAHRLQRSFAAGKRHALVIVSEGVGLLLGTPANKFKAKEFVAGYLRDDIEGWSQENKPDVRVQELGYPVRGADPCRFDMILGAELGARAVTCLIKKRTEVMLGWSRQNGIREIEFAEVAALSNRPPGEIWVDRPRWQELLELHEVLTCPPGQAEALRSGGNSFVRSWPPESAPPSEC